MFECGIWEALEWTWNQCMNARMCPITFHWQNLIQSLKLIKSHTLRQDKKKLESLVMQARSVQPLKKIEKTLTKYLLIIFTYRMVSISYLSSLNVLQKTEKFCFFSWIIQHKVKVFKLPSMLRIALINYHSP